MKQLTRIFLATCLTLLAIIALVGCSKTSSTTDNATRTITYKDQQYTVPTNPQRIATLSNSVLYLLDAVGGQSIDRVDSTEPVPDTFKDLPSIGTTANINMETLLGLKPDLVLGLGNQHGKYEGQLKSNGLPYILINYDGIKDNAPLLLFLGELTHNEAKAQAVVADYNKKIDTVKSVAQQQEPAKVAVLRATAKAVTAETDLAITASMVKELGMNNIVLQGDYDKTAKTIPYSLEKLAVDDPDIIFISTMGKKEDITKTMEKEMTNNPAWQNLKAVRNHKVFYLPSNRFLLNPGLHTPEAMAELVKLAYDKEVTF
ncbi:ABC transporter substrate-binding protein [uncultured Veillonella sp.]|uniref:ABC transporter substrate-binding protein n=1 Tax=uncultured Veillonella sp. TaxID=159268 RepID=UPI0025F28162|nr:ABC transporter substrate-binding protein [uncultured Veillonella sp.]